MRQPFILTDLADIAQKERCALLVVDPQHDFCSSEGAIARRGVACDVRMLPNQKARRGTGDSIWLIKEGTRGADWYEGVIPPVAGEPVVTKDGYDAFEYTDLDLILRGAGVSTIVLTGFTTNVCVETTARHGDARGYYVVVVDDCTGAPTRAEHEAALFNIRTYFGHVTDSATLAELWRRS